MALDVSHIGFDNCISTTTVDGNTLFSNAGRVLHRGAEAEGSLSLTGWLRAFGNYSLLLRATFLDSGMTGPTRAHLPALFVADFV